jgi:hypothetical protein
LYSGLGTNLALQEEFSDLTLTEIVDECFYMLLPTVHAECDIDLTVIHPSFNSIQQDNTPGGLLVQKSLGNIVTQLGGYLPIYLTSQGILGAKMLSGMLNGLLQSSQFEVDTNLFPYLLDKVNCSYNLNFDVTSSIVEPLQSFSLPLKRQEVPHINDSGVYGFFLKTQDGLTHLGLGSALSCEDRLVDHIASLNSKRSQQFMHQFILANGGISSVTWCPLITSPNLVHDWSLDSNSLNMSLGASKVLRGFTQFHIRVLEQAMMDKYTPYMNSNTSNVIFFNFAFSNDDFNAPLSTGKIYQAFDSSMTKILATTGSYNKLGKLVGLSNVSVRNAMNWHLGIDMTINGEEVHGYLRESGTPIRTVPLENQLAPKDKHALLVLPNRTLYDLIPGKIYAITVDTLSDFGIYNNERDLWTSLNPSSVDKLSTMTGLEGKRYLNNRVGRYMNIDRSGGNLTELGNFYFCRHPHFLAGLAKTAEAIFVINIITGLCTLYPNITQVSHTNRTSIRTHLNKGTLHNKIFKYIYQSEFIKYFPEAKEGFTLTKQQLQIVMTIPPRK